MSFMSVPIFPIFETDLVDYDPQAFDGRFLGEALDALEIIARAKGIPVLEDFHAMTEQEASDLLEAFGAIPQNGEQITPAFDQIIESLGTGADSVYLNLQDEMKALATQVEEGQIAQEDFANTVATKMGQYFTGRFGDTDFPRATQLGDKSPEEDEEDDYEIRWHDAADGLAAATALRKEAENDAPFVARYPDAITELKEIETLLGKATAAGVRFAYEYDV